MNEQITLLDGVEKEGLTSKIINELIGINESFELPDKLMNLLLVAKDRQSLFNNFLKYNFDLQSDIFRDYFQTEHSDRKGLKQDYTPDCLCKLISRMQCNSNNILDVCSGTGSLTIASFNEDQFFQCEELSKRSIPVLIFNLSIRNINALVIEKDVLTNKIYNIYKLEKGENFSDIKQLENIEEKKFDVVISNPPYSLQWNPKYDDRFNGYELAPKSKADYAFVLDIVYRLNDNGMALIILPHGVLFRGQREGNIRKQLIKNNLIDAIIGLPDKLFLNTDIPVLILVIKKNRPTSDILFIDSSKKYVKQSKQNDMNDKQINKIVDTYKNRREIEKYSRLVSLNEIEENDYNLNIPRYVDTFEEEEPVDLKQCVEDIIAIEKETKEVERELKRMLEQLEGTTPQTKRYYEESIKPMLNWLR